MEKGDQQLVKIYNEFRSQRSAYSLFVTVRLLFMHATMKFSRSTLLVLTVLAATSVGKVQIKRGLPSYSPTSTNPSYQLSSVSAQPAYKALRAISELKSLPATQQYVAQPAAYSQPAYSQPAYSQPSAQQYYQQAEPQAAGYSQPAVAKYTPASAVQKYSLAPQAQPQQYSSAADVSSFSYSSPVVSYNNLGLLQQTIGKGAVIQPQQQVTYSSAQSAKVQYSPQPSQANYEIQNTYQAVAQKPVYAETPQAQYQAQVQAYAQAQATQAQTLAEAQAKAQSKAQAQAVTFQATSPAQKFSYPQVPNYQIVQGVPKSSPQVSYAGSPQQVAYSAPQGAAQGYEVAAHSAPQIFYSQPTTQPQYYQVPQSPKYLRAGVTYLQ